MPFITYISQFARRYNYIINSSNVVGNKCKIVGQQLHPKFGSNDVEMTVTAVESREKFDDHPEILDVVRLNAMVIYGGVIYGPDVSGISGRYFGKINDPQFEEFSREMFSEFCDA